jgi:hypothetical protein
LNHKILIWGIIALMIIPFLTENVFAGYCTTVVGDYIQDTNSSIQSQDYFYDRDTGFKFSLNDESKTYGNFTAYTTCSDYQTRENEVVLVHGHYKNIHSVLGYNLCLEDLENPSHDISEQIIINSSKITYFEDGLGDDSAEALKMAIEIGAVQYKIFTDTVPLKNIYVENYEGNISRVIDKVYHGKIVLFGEEYYIKKIENTTRIYLAKGEVKEVTNTSFASDYNGYQFKIDNLIYGSQYNVSGVVLDVKKPNGTIVQVEVNESSNAVVDEIEIAGVYAEEWALGKSGQFIVYDLSTQVILDDGEEFVIGGKTYEDWVVRFDTLDNCTGSECVYNEDTEEWECNIPECDHSEYERMGNSTRALLKDITIKYEHNLDGDEALGIDESLSFPNLFKLTFKGYLDNNFTEGACSGLGDDNILLERGDENYSMVLTLTADDSNKYSRVRLDNGPFIRNDLFIAGGNLYKFDSYSVDGDENTVDVILVSELGNSTVELTNMILFCSDDVEEVNSTATRAACGGDILFRELALVNALDSGGDFDQDVIFPVDPEDIYIKQNVTSLGGRRDVLFALGYAIIVNAGFADNFDNGTPPTLAVKGDLVGNFSRFYTDDYNLNMNVYTTNDTEANDYLSYESIVNFTTADGDVAIHMYDRARVSSDDLDYDNSLVFGSLILDTDDDAMLIVPKGGDIFTIDRAASERIYVVDVCHPTKNVDATYFIGTSEQEIFICDLAGDYWPCDEVELSEVVSLITLWIGDEASLREVVALINAWASD